MDNCLTCEYFTNVREHMFNITTGKCGAPVQIVACQPLPACVVRRQIYVDGDKVYFGRSNRDEPFTECLAYNKKYVLIRRDR